MSNHPHIDTAVHFHFKPAVSQDHPNFDKIRNFDLYRPAVMVDGEAHATHIDTIMIGAGNISLLARFIAPRDLSAHYWVSTAGAVYQLVDPEHRAWFAGRTAYGPEVKLSVLGDTKLPCLPERDGAEACKNPTSISLNDNAIGVWFEIKDEGVSYSKAQINAGLALITAINADFVATAGNLVSYNAGRVSARGYEEVRAPIHELRMATNIKYAHAYQAVANIPETCIASEGDQGKVIGDALAAFNSLGIRVAAEKLEAASFDTWFKEVVHVFHQDTHAMEADCLTERDVALLAAFNSETVEAMTSTSEHGHNEL